MDQAEAMFVVLSTALSCEGGGDTVPSKLRFYFKLSKLRYILEHIFYNHIKMFITVLLILEKILKFSYEMYYRHYLTSILNF
jgi:hypothetical protein